MLKVSWSRLVAALIYCCTICLSGSSEALQHVDGGNIGVSNSIATPGQPLYYLMADVGSTVGPNDELKRTNRHLMKWWEDLFGQNNCCNNNNNNLLNNNYNNILPNNCNGLQLQHLDPFKQMKLFKKLPDLWGNNCGGQCGQCGGLQPVNNYAAPVAPGYGSGDGYAQPTQPAPAVPVAPVDYNPAPAPPSGGYETPNPAYDGPGDGDAGYVAPAAPPPPPPAAESYEAPPAAEYAAPPADSYEAPAPEPPTYEPAAPAPAPESYSKVDDYGKADKGYGGAQQPPQIVYQPIIYLTTSPGAKGEMDFRPKPQEQSYEASKEPPQPQPVYEQPTPIPAPVYAPPPAPAPAPAPAPPCNTPACAGYLPLVGVPFYSYPAPPAPPPAPVYAAPPPPPPPAAPVYAPPPVAPAAPSYASPACQTPIRLSLYDQPYRVAPELFQEYNYRLSLADNNNSL